MTYQTNKFLSHGIKHGRQSPGKKLWVVLLVVLVAALFLVLASLNPVRGLISNSLSPFIKFGNYFYENVGRIPKIFSLKDSLMKENENLRAEAEENRLKAIDYEFVKQENEELRKELRLKPEGNFITSKVIGKPPQTPPGSLILDRGEEDGISVGDNVFVSEKVLIGKISEITGGKSTVSLNSFGGAVSYGLVNRTEEPIELKGAGGGCMEAKVPIDFDIVEGDKILVNDSSACLMATVGKVEKDTAMGVQNVFLSLPTSLSDIDIVYVRP